MPDRDDLPFTDPYEDEPEAPVTHTERKTKKKAKEKKK